MDGISIDRVTIEDGTGPDGKPFRYIRVAYTFENVTDSDTVAPYTDINAYQDGIKLDRSYKVQDQRAQKQIEPGGKLKSFTAFAPDSGDGSGHGQGDGARREGAEVGAMLLHREPGACNKTVHTGIPTHICICTYMRLRTCAYG